MSPITRDEAALLEGRAKYEASFDRVLESIKQIREKKGPHFERWKAGMQAYLDSLEEEPS